jgi:glyoxylase-like metal-dependent hydrolase (beta-lactamase superfamily II)
MDYRVISIGAMAAHPLRGERSPVRTGHATTTLIVTGPRAILVDPGLPGAALVARLQERAGLSPKDVTDVFLTSFHPDTHRGIEAFAHARWLIHDVEREAVGVQLATALKDLLTRSERQGGVAKDQSLEEVLRHEVAVLSRCEVAPQTLGERVDVFPLGGVSPGMCGLLLEGTRFTTLVCGDAIPTVEHLEQGKAPQHAPEIDQARASFEEAVEIADMLVLGRDNIVVNPAKRPF